jgi:GNAT superfamily N-acetyltransferase
MRMPAGPTAAQRIELGRSRQHEVVELFAAAFEHDPLFEYICRNAAPRYSRRLRCVLRCFGGVTLAAGSSRIGIVREDQLLCVAEVQSPGATGGALLARAWMLRLLATAGPRAALRAREFFRAASAARPEAPHCDLRAIAVLPSAQGQGLAGELLRAVHEWSERHPSATGVALDTENAANLPLYEHFGYRVIGTFRVGPVTAWAMFRPNRSRAIAP